MWNRISRLSSLDTTSFKGTLHSGDFGLDSGIKEMADRLAAAGFVALAPDLYHGELAGHDEMDKAGELMQACRPIGRAAT